MESSIRYSHSKDTAIQRLNTMKKKDESSHKSVNYDKLTNDFAYDNNKIRDIYHNNLSSKGD